MQIFCRQGYVKTSGIFLHMGDAACLGYGDDILCAHHPCQHDLRGSGIMPVGYLYQRLVIAQPSFAQRRVGHVSISVKPNSIPRRRACISSLRLRPIWYVP